MNKTIVAMHNSNCVLAFVFLVVIVAQSAIDIYLPSLPAMAEYFRTSNDMVQLTLSVFVIGYAFSQLIYGPLSDHFGRRPVLLFGLALFSTASLLCALSSSIKFLLLCRLLQGLGAGALNIHQRILIRDVFEGKHLNKNASYVATIWAFVPMIAPLAGGYIQFYFNWRTNFAVLAVMEILLLFAIAKWLPETRKIYEPAKLTFKKIIKDYKTLLTNRVFIGSVMSCALINGIFLAFNIAAPFLFQERLKTPPVVYGWILAISGSGFLVGSYFNSHLAQYYNIQKIILFGFFLSFLGSFALLAFLVLHVFTIVTVVISIMTIFLGIGFIYANCIANGIKHFPHIVGSAGAVFGFMVSLIGGLISVVFTHFTAISIKPLTFTVLLLLIFSFVFYLKLLDPFSAITRLG